MVVTRPRMSPLIPGTERHEPGRCQHSRHQSSRDVSSQTGTTTVALAAGNTLILPYQTGAGTRANDNGLMASVSVTSDQPIVLGSMMANGPPNAISCSKLPK